MKIINGGIAKDLRGEIRFVNDFDMSKVKRFYIIKNSNTELVRGWRGHKIEQRWFFVLNGKFRIDLVKVDDWDNCSKDLNVEMIELSCEKNSVFHVPSGFATAFQALENDSELLVFSDYGIENAVNDDYTWPIDYFFKRNLLK